MMQTIPHTAVALIVIDAQESFRQRPYWAEGDAADYAAYVAAQQSLIDAASAAKLPIVQIFHEQADGGSFDPARGYVRTLAELRIAPDAVFHKTRHSALVGTGLDVWLRERGVGKLIISGIRTEQCCETTTRAASDAGFAVDYALDATLTFPMTAADGTTSNAAAIKRHTRMVLEGRFARFPSQAELVANLVANSGA
jgi:nicotinamidase-related amidase